jgi:hypothetical protein
MQRRILLFLLLVFAGLSFKPGKLSAQVSKRPFHIQYDFRKTDSFFRNDTVLNLKRKRMVTGMAVGGYLVAAAYIGGVWYGNEELTRFHFFDDWNEWQQFDKTGHLLGGYHASKWMIDLYKWSGMEKRKAILIGGTAGFLGMASIEVFDGFAQQWGASWSDLGADLVGSALAMGNQALWNENRIQLKISYLKSPYADVDSLSYLFGGNPLEWLLKDYNGHAFWVSVRMHSFLPEGKFKRIYPRWLNLAVGYGGEGMIGGYGRDNPADIRAREFRQYYVGLDIDLSNIKTRSGFLNSVFSFVNFLRIPAPALQFDRNGVKFLPLR